VLAGGSPPHIISLLKPAEPLLGHVPDAAQKRLRPSLRVATIRGEGRTHTRYHVGSVRKSRRGRALRYLRSVPLPVSRACGWARANARMPAISSLRSTIGSRKGPTPQFWKRPGQCWSRSTDWARPPGD